MAPRRKAIAYYARTTPDGGPRGYSKAAQQGQLHHHAKHTYRSTRGDVSECLRLERHCERLIRDIERARSAGRDGKLDRLFDQLGRATGRLKAIQ